MDRTKLLHIVTAAIIAGHTEQAERIYIEDDEELLDFIVE